MKERLRSSVLLSPKRYVKRFCLVILEYDTPFEDLLRPPVSPRRIEREPEVWRSPKVWRNVSGMGSIKV